MRARPCLLLAPVLLSAPLLLTSCGKDEADFDDLDGQIGNVPGQFNLRLGAKYRAVVDKLQDKLESVFPGASAKLTARFGGEDAATDEKGTKLSDLLKVDLPGTDNAKVNKYAFKELKKLSGDDGAYFDLVDTEKFMNKSVYEPPTAGSPTYDPNLKDQYYLDMIRWSDAMKTVTPAMVEAAAPVVVAVLDTGILAKHEDLADVLWKSSGGAVGYDAASGKELGVDATDGNGHGTHVAGIIAGKGGNTKGIHGVGYLPRASGESVTKVMAVRVLNDNGSGTSEQLSKGLKWAVDQHWAQQKADATQAKQRMIVNMSLGGPFEAKDFDYTTGADGTYQFEDDLINYATSKGDVLIVVAAGNESCGISGECDLFGQTFEQTYYFPCSYKNVLCVAATTHEDKLAGFSNRKASVGIAAPGYQIVSTIPQSTSSYGYYSGTSQATPVTAGAASVLWAVYPDFTAEEVKAILQKTAAQISDVTSQIASHGRLDLKAALDYAAALKAAGKKPSQLEPTGVATTATKPTTPPAQGDLAPDAKSPDAVAGNGPDSKGEGSAKGCGVAGNGTGSIGFLLLLAGLAPLLTLPRRR